jgi:hypothetical protein
MLGGAVSHLHVSYQLSAISYQLSAISYRQLPRVACSQRRERARCVIDLASGNQG